ncbi:MAG: hypothetical protein J6040_07740 [Clostridiales bacterium]|nr:hypothetical protein [Clostridiales bacterium]MBP5493011.1 hypothetical protein [Clostridiales bacterium]
MKKRLIGLVVYGEFVGADGQTNPIFQEQKEMVDEALTKKEITEGEYKASISDLKDKCGVPDIRYM